MSSRVNANGALNKAWRGVSVRGAGKAVPPNASMLEARAAARAVEADPLRHAFGEPPPGRSALDKMRKAGRRI